jgi:hypothetical protein
VKTANEILAAIHIYTSLTADRRIDLCQQRGGNLDKGDPAQVDGGSKSSHVAYDATAQSHHAVASFEPGFIKKTKHPLNRLNRLKAFAVTD